MKKAFRTTLLSFACGALACISLAAKADAQDYPNRSIRIVVPYPPGGSADVIGRMVGEKLQKSIGQPVVIENKGGASGAIGSEYVARSEADGYTLLVAISDTHAINPAVAAKLPYHPTKDFTPISLLAIQPFVLAVGPRVQASNLADFIKVAKDKPDSISYASNGPGGLQHLAMTLLSTAVGMKTVHVPYKGAGPALSDVMGGHVDAIFISLQGAGGNFKTDKLRALAVTSPQRLLVASDIPTFAESGHASFQVNQWYGLLAPAGTPPAIIAKLNEHVKAAITAPDVSEKLNAVGTEPVGSTPDHFAAFLDKEIAQWANVAKTNNIRIEQ